MKRKDFRKLHLEFRKIAVRGIWIIIYTLLVFCLFAFMGCAKPLYKIQTQEVLIPIQCNLELPLKPKENGSFESHKELAVYYKEVEQIAKDCTKN